MTTSKLGLPEVIGSMAADVPLVVNNLAQAVDSKAGVAGGLALHDDVLSKATKEEVSALSTAVSTKAEQSDLNQTNAQLAETSKRKDFVRFGKLTMPADFPVPVPLNLYRSITDGKVSHDFDFDALLATSTATVYLSNTTGMTGNDGLTPETPARNFQQAMTIVAGLPNLTVTIALMNSTFSYTDFNSVYEYVLNKNVVLRPHNVNKVAIHSGRTSSTFTWTADGTTWKATRSAVSRVIDTAKVDYRGNSKELLKMNTLAEAQSTPGSWYTDGASVWIRRSDDTPIDNSVIMMLPLGSEIRFTNSGYNLILDKVEFLFESTTGNALYVLCSSTNSGKVYHRHCAFAYGKLNGLRTDKQRGTLGFHSRAYGNGSDGFNYHGQLVTNPYEFAFEYFCLGHDNGAVIGSTGNATTAHEGMTTLRVGSVGYDCFGPICADVNGCYSVLIDCTMFDSKRVAGATKAAYYFDGAGAVKRGKAYLINCGGGGVDTYTLNSDGNVDLYVKNITGHQIPSTVVLNYLN